MAKTPRLNYADASNGGLLSAGAQRNGAVLMGSGAGNGRTGIYPRALLANTSSVTLQSSGTSRHGV
jgi:hypothetical protein